MVSGEIFKGLNVIASYSYTDAEVTKDNFYGVGNQLANVPKNSASLWTTYELQQGNLKGLGFGIGAFLIGARQGDLDNTFTLPGYTRTDAAIYYRGDRWKANLNFQNLFNVNYVRASEGFREAVTPGNPFTVVGSLSFEF